MIEVLAQHTAHAESLRDALKKANDQAERFEREWYLRGDEIERLREWIHAEGERNNVCTYNILGKVCGYCECKRKPVDAGEER